MWRPMQRTALVVMALGTLWLSVGTSGQSTLAPSTRTASGRTTPPTCAARNTRRSIRSTPTNFNKLEVAWRFKTDNLGTRPEFKLEGTPLMVGGVLYTTAGTRRSVVALDAQTGELIWVAPLSAKARAAPSRRASCPGRGLAYWTDGKGDDRVLYVTTGYRLIALNAKTGAPDPVVRQGRRRRSEGGRGLRQRASRSISRPARSACTRRRPSSRTPSSSDRR